LKNLRTLRVWELTEDKRGAISKSSTYKLQFNLKIKVILRILLDSAWFPCINCLIKSWTATLFHNGAIDSVILQVLINSQPRIKRCNGRMKLNSLLPAQNTGIPSAFRLQDLTLAPPVWSSDLQTGTELHTRYFKSQFPESRLWDFPPFTIT
jgi:hypothetical protein